MEAFHPPLNTEKFIQYLQATQKIWRLRDYIKNLEQFDALSNAIARSSIVEEINHFDSPTLEKENIRKFVAALESNSSLTSLSVGYISCKDNSDFQPLFETLARKNQLRSLSLRFENDNDVLIPILLHYCRNATALTSLSFGNNFTEHVALQFLDALEDQHNLKELCLGDAGEWSHETLKKLAQFLNRHKNIKNYHADCPYETLEFLAEFVEDPSVIGFSKSENIKDGDDDEEFERVAQKIQPVQDVVLQSHPANMTELFIDVLPMEINKKILYSLNISPLMAFLRANKRTTEFGRSFNFWRDYYLTHFDCIPEEILEAVGVKYGDQLTRASSIDELFPTNIWILALKAMKDVYWVNLADLPQDRNPMVQLVSKSFPQLKYQHAFGEMSDDFAWFKAEGSIDSNKYMAHKIGVQYQKEFNKYNAILLRKFNYVDHMYKNDPFDHLHYVLEWIQAESPKEFLEKFKPLAEMYVVLNYNNHYTSHYKIFPQNCLDEHFTNLTLALSKMNEKIEEHITKLLNTIDHSTIDLQYLERVITNFKNATPVVEFSWNKQKLPKRSDLNAKKIYSYGDRLLDFHTGDWELPEHIEKPKISTDLKKKKLRVQKKSVKIEILRLIRVILNYIMMPLLRVFWPQNPKDVDIYKTNCYYFFTATKQYEQFYLSPYVPIDSVSITKGYPKHWPAIAIGVSHLTIDQILTVVDDMIVNKDTEASIMLLMRSLEKIGFYSKNVLDELRNFLLRATKKE